MAGIVDKIKTFMSLKSLTTRALAEKLGYNEKTLGNKVTGRREFDLDEIVAILKAFPELSAEWLLRDEGSMWRQTEVYSVSSQLDEALQTDSLAKKILEQMNIEELVKTEIQKQLKKNA